MMMFLFLPSKLMSRIRPFFLNLLISFAIQLSVLSIVLARYALLAKHSSNDPISASRHFWNHVTSFLSHSDAGIQTPLKARESFGCGGVASPPFFGRFITPKAYLRRPIRAMLKVGFCVSSETVPFALHQGQEIFTSSNGLHSSTER